MNYVSANKIIFGESLKIIFKALMTLGQKLVEGKLLNKCYCDTEAIFKNRRILFHFETK